MATASHEHTVTTALLIALVLSVSAGAVAGRPSAASGKPRSTAQRPTVQIVRVSDPGFHWADAGIGAAAGFGLSMLVVGAALLVAGARNTHQKEGG